VFYIGIQLCVCKIYARHYFLIDKCGTRKNSKNEIIIQNGSRSEFFWAFIRDIKKITTAAPYSISMIYHLIFNGIFHAVVR